MSTIFVLHGGKTSKDSVHTDSFFAEFTKLVDKDTVNILMCYWAREKDKWQTMFERDKVKILKGTTKQVNFTLPENPEDLRQKIDSHDVLYVAGGDAEPIERFLPELNWLKEKLEGKVYLGSSMGAFIVSANYVLSFDESDTSTVHKGLGLVPYNSLMHWNMEEEKERKLALLKEISDLPILTLNEEESTKIVN